MVSEVWRTLTKTQLRKYSFHEPQKFLWQRLTRRKFWDNDSSAEISETRIHRNFWNNGPEKFLGQRSTKISGTIRTYKFLRPFNAQLIIIFQFALRFQFPSANEKNHFLRQFTARSSWYVIENKARQEASFIVVLYSTVFLFSLLYRSGRVCLSPNTP